MQTAGQIELTPPTQNVHTGSTCFCKSCNCSKAGSVDVCGMADVRGPPQRLCNEADVCWAGLSGEQGCSEAGVFCRLESAASNGSRRGGRERCPCGGAGPPALPEDDSLLPGSAKSGLTQPDPSPSLGRAWHPHSHTAVRPESARARPAEAPVSARSAPGP